MVAISEKPRKPHPSFPMTAYPHGQRCKKIRGKMHFFGVWSQPQNDRDHDYAVADDVHAGCTPRPEKLSRTEPAVKDVCNAYLSR